MNKFNDVRTVVFANTPNLFGFDSPKQTETVFVFSLKHSSKTIRQDSFYSRAVVFASESISSNIFMNIQNEVKMRLFAKRQSKEVA